MITDGVCIVPASATVVADASTPETVLAVFIELDDSTPVADTGTDVSTVRIVAVDVTVVALGAAVVVGAAVRGVTDKAVTVAWGVADDVALDVLSVD